jgi:hypothetical protein
MDRAFSHSKGISEEALQNIILLIEAIYKSTEIKQ